ncbi:MAG: GHKL domain-containing protein [Lachnospiraceae bacterium]|nr:GHKL domain-containing protein [Lachnospiraceae bacterium]
MEILVYLVLPCVGSIFLISSMFYGAYRIAGQPKLSGGRLGLMAAYTAVAVACSLLGSTWVNLAFGILFPFAAMWILKASKSCLVPYFILAVAVFLTDVVVITGYEMLIVRGILFLNSTELLYILLMVLDRMTEFMVICLIAVAAGKRTGRHITVRQVVLSILLPLFSIFNMYCMVYLMQIYMVKGSVILLLINLLLLIGLNIYFCVLVDVMSENHKLESEKNFYRRQSEMQYRYYAREEEKYEESRKLIHDIRNHILAMEELYDSEKAEAAAHYAGDIHQMLNNLGQKYYTSEKLLNIILNDKVRQMQRAGIREDIKVGELSLDFMRDMDVTALFANLLDNAIAAAAESREGFVKLRINNVRQFVSITVENSSDREPVKTKNGFRSGKEGHEGVGIRSIRRTVEQYGGDVQFDWQEGVFTAKVMLAAE